MGVVPMITEIDDYFAKGCGRCERFDTADCSAQKWKAGLEALRRICCEAGMEEIVKWGHPCYMHAGRNVAILGALRGDFRLNFFHAELMKDPHGVLEKQGENTQFPDMIRFTDAAEVAGRELILRSYLKEAMGYASLGLKPLKREREIELPEELVEAMAADVELAGAFEALTPGRKRSYVIHLSGAKTTATRVARIARCRGRILAGKGALER